LISLREAGWLDIRWCAADEAMGADLVHTSTRDDGLPGWRPLPELLAASDIVSPHVPLTAATHHLLDRDARRTGRLAAAGLGVSPSSRWPPTTRCCAWTTWCSPRTSPDT